MEENRRLKQASVTIVSTCYAMVLVMQHCSGNAESALYL
jgi:hypothetical protein